jgi:hypothetical protein
MFDPTKITTFIGLAAAAIWAICYVSNRRRSVVLATLVVALAALGTAAALELTQHVDVCATVHGLRLNEVCAEGKDCEPGKDFIEVVNPNATPIGLACYAIGDQRSARDGQTRVDAKPVLLDGELAPGAIRAWDEDQLGFRISWKTRDQGESEEGRFLRKIKWQVGTWRIITQRGIERRRRPSGPTTRSSGPASPAAERQR